MCHERVQSGSKPFRVRIPQRHERAAAALDIERGRAAEQDDIRAGDPRRARPGALRPRKRGSVGLRGIGSGEHQRQGLGGMLAQALDGSGESELRSAQSLDEVPPPAEAQRLEVPQLPVHGRVAAGHALAADAVARDDALALEEQLGERARVRVAREDRGGAGPAALRRGDRIGPATREATRPALRPRSLEAACGPKRLPGVVRHLAGPDELPECR